VTGFNEIIKCSIKVGLWLSLRHRRASVSYRRPRLFFAWFINTWTDQPLPT